MVEYFTDNKKRVRKIDKTNGRPHSKSMEKSNSETSQEDRIKFAQERLKKDYKKVRMENRAWKGIRAYTDDVIIDGVPVVFEIHTHHPWGKYIITAYDDNRGLEKLSGLSHMKFDKFEQAKSYLETRFKIKIELDEDPSNHQTWKKNIEQTDHELPFDRKYWSLPENKRNKIDVHESIEEFLKRNGYA